MDGAGEVGFGGTDRFRIERRLGAGAFGVVYRAFDRELDHVVALKTLQHAHPTALYRFKQEFRSLADVVHPNLVQLYELLSDGDRWFFTMELVEGVDLLEHLEGPATMPSAPPVAHSATTVHPLHTVTLEAPPPAASAPSEALPGPVRADRAPALSPTYLERLRQVLLQLAEGVRALHAAGKLHRDLKPANVMVSAEGRVVLLDFGLIRELAPSKLEQETLAGDVEGTPRYMSPEQAAGAPLTEASDWYAVGVMLFKAVTGEAPITGTLLQLLQAKQRVDLAPPSRLVSGVPEDLDKLCHDLLRRDPAARPDGPEVLRRLRAAPADAARALPPSGPPRREVPFLGRAHHLEVLRRAYAAVREGQTATVLVRGRSGMGKTALVERFLEDLDPTDEAVVLPGRCYQQESVPYKGLDSVVDGLSRYLRRLDHAGALELLPRHVLALSRVFPVLERVDAVAGASRKVLRNADPVEVRRRAFAALRELLCRLGDRRPLILFIDDLQWGDLDSARLLRQLLRPPDPPALLFVGAFRSEDAETSPSLEVLLREASAEDALPDVRRIEVGELEPAEARELAAALLTDSPGADALADDIARESGGSPIFCAELAQHACATPTGDDDPSGPIELDDMIRRRVSRLPADARELLAVVAIAGHPTDLRVATAAAGLARDPSTGLRTGGHRALALLRAERLVRTLGTGADARIATYHDRIRESVVAGLESEARRVRHGELGLALEKDPGVDPERLAAHFHEAGELQKAAAYAAIAAEVASTALAFARAARLYRLAIDLRTAEGPRTRPLWLELGQALANAGRGAEAAEAYLKVAEGLPADEALEPRKLAAQQLLWSGHLDEGVAVVRDVLRAVGMELPRYHAWNILKLLLRRAWLHLRGFGFVEQTAAKIEPETLVRIDTCEVVANTIGTADSTAAMADFITRYVLLALRTGESGRVAIGFSLEAWLRGFSGDARGGQKLIARALALAERSGSDPEVVGRVLALASLVAWWSGGSWNEAFERAETATRFLEERPAGMRFFCVLSQVGFAVSCCYLGRLKDLSRRLPGLVQDAQERGDRFAEYNLVCPEPLTFVLLAADEVGRLRHEKERCLRHRTVPGWNRLFGSLFSVDCGLYTGEIEPTWRRLQEGWPALRRHPLLRAPFLWNLAWFSRARGALGAAAATTGGDRRDCLRAARRAARKLGRGKMSFSRPAASLVRAGLTSLARGPEEALPHLEQAEAGYEAADMALHAAVCRRRRGQVIGGDEGAALIAASERWMAGEDIKKPERMASVLAPGRWCAS